MRLKVWFVLVFASLGYGKSSNRNFLAAITYHQASSVRSKLGDKITHKKRAIRFSGWLCFDLLVKVGWSEGDNDFA